MYSTCLHCNGALGANEALETLPIGRRVAFDAAQGRLWVVCRGCGKWNLVPFDARLETIDACERLYRDTATRYSTGTIGLARLRDGLALVRIGPALRPEFAAWRYGESYRRRRKRSLIIGGTVAAAGLGAFLGMGAAGVAVGGMTYVGWTGVRRLVGAAIHRRAKFTVQDPVVPHARLTVKHTQLGNAVLHWEADELGLVVPRPWEWTNYAGPARWQGPEVRSVGRRVVGGLNLLAGRRDELDRATALLAEERGDLEGWLRQAAELRAPHGLRANMKEGTGAFEWHEIKGPGVVLKALPASQRLAVEMWLNEDIERLWLEGELKMLEREWREAERIAKIADDLVLEPLA